jgi:thymidylate kinase
MTKLNSTATPKLIILEGVDRSGKDTMWEEIDKQTKYRHMVMDRGPIGFKTYCELFSKPRELFVAYHAMEEEMCNLDNVLVIYIDCSTEVLIDRCIKTNHEIIDYDRHKSVYETFFNSSKLPKIKVDTTERHARDIVRDLIVEGIL